MREIVLVLFAVTVLASLVVVVVQTVRRRADPDRSRGPERPRTAAQKAQDRRTEMAWFIVLLVVIVGLLLAYQLLGATS